MPRCSSLPRFDNAAFALRPPSALRGAVGGASMTTPGGAGTTLRPHARLPVLGASASIIGSELSSLLGSGPWLCPVPLQGVSTSACHLDFAQNGAPSTRRETCADSPGECFRPRMEFRHFQRELGPPPCRPRLGRHCQNLPQEPLHPQLAGIRRA